LPKVLGWDLSVMFSTEKFRVGDGRPDAQAGLRSGTSAKSMFSYDQTAHTYQILGFALFRVPRVDPAGCRYIKHQPLSPYLSVLSSTNSVVVTVVGGLSDLKSDLIEKIGENWVRSRIEVMP